MLIKWWEDPGIGFTAMDEFQRRINRLIEDYGGQARTARAGSSLNARLKDEGDHLTLSVDMPGIDEKDIKLTINNSMMSVAAERQNGAPEGYSVHRQERGRYKLSRSLTFPLEVEAAKAEAKLKNGVLTVSLPKAEVAKPRQISVKAG